MKNYILFLINFLLIGVCLKGQDIGVSGIFNSSTIPETHTSTLVVLFNNNSSSTLNEAYIIADFPVNGEYSTPTNAPSGSGAQYFDWTTNLNSWTGVLNTPMAGMDVHSLVFSVVGVVETPSSGLPTLLFVDIIGGSDGNPANNNADPDLIVDNSVLPVDLVDFTGFNQECGVNVLEWTVASEINNRGFEIMRSRNGNDYETLDFVKGQEFSSVKTIYSYTDNLSDEDAANGFYYMFKQIDLDGQFEFSSEIYVESQCARGLLTLEVYPNPAKDFVNISFNEKVESQVNISITTIDGKVHSKMSLDSGFNHYMLPLNDLIDGIYYLKVSTLGLTKTHKIIIIR